MAIVEQVFKPISITNSLNMAPLDVTYIQEDPTATNDLNIAPTGIVGGSPFIEVNFDIVGELVGTQKIQLVFLDNNWMGVHIEVFENNVLKHTSAVTYNGYNNIVTTFTFDASILADKTGQSMRVRAIAHVSTGLTINYIKALQLVASVDIFVPPVWEDLKIDWTPTDFYNYEDLNRVESACDYIAYQISNFYATDVPIETVKDRTMETIEYADSLARIEQNILTLNTALTRPLTLIEPKVNWTHGEAFSYVDANRLEQNLFFIYDQIEKALSMFKYCGQTICGEEGV